MYNQIYEKEFRAYCIEEYTYTNLYTPDKVTIKKGEIIDVIFRKYESDNMDKVVTYSYVIKATQHSIRKYNNHFTSIAHSRKLKIERLLKMK